MRDFGNDIGELMIYCITLKISTSFKALFLSLADKGEIGEKKKVFIIWRFFNKSSLEYDSKSLEKDFKILEIKFGNFLVELIVSNFYKINIEYFYYFSEKFFLG